MGALGPLSSARSHGTILRLRRSVGQMALGPWDPDVLVSPEPVSCQGECSSWYAENLDLNGVVGHPAGLLDTMLAVQEKLFC